jgi:hypothetical protein
VIHSGRWSTFVVTIACYDCLVTYICVWQSTKHGLTMMRGTGGTDSLNTTGRVLLTGVFSLMRPYLPFVIVALAIVSLGIDSLNTTCPALLTGVFSLMRPSLYYRCAVQGSFRGRSGICKFQGFQPKRVHPNPRTIHHNTHTSHRTKGDTSTYNSSLSTTRLIQQSTRTRGCRRDP